jgi:hypothetical protein
LRLSYSTETEHLESHERIQMSILYGITVGFLQITNICVMWTVEGVQLQQSLH